MRNIMDEPMTEELLEDLLASEAPTDYLDSHDLTDRTLADLLTQLLDLHGLKRAEVVRAAGLDATYGYQLFTGARGNPARDKVLQLAFAMGLSLRECDRLLQAAGKAKLYCKNRRDAIIMFCLDRHTTINEANEQLFARNEQTIG